jgi:hypothetical protein
MSIITVTQEAELGGSQIEASPDKNIIEILFQKTSWLWLAYS